MPGPQTQAVCGVQMPYLSSSYRYLAATKPGLLRDLQAVLDGVWARALRVFPLEAAEMMKIGEVDAICDLSLDEDLQISYVSPGPSLETLPDFISHARTMVGTDAVLLGEYPNPRSYGTFPTILAEYVRETGRLTLEETIKKMTSMAALRLDIRDRGMLRDGMKADIVVFDPSTVMSPSTRAQPKQFPVGIEYVLVNGSVVVDGGQHTGALVGRALRHGNA